MPGDGKEVKAANEPGISALERDPNVNVVEVPGETVTWKDQVLGACSFSESHGS
jgi:hypothetical protein